MDAPTGIQADLEALYERQYRQPVNAVLEKCNTLLGLPLIQRATSSGRVSVHTAVTSLMTMVFERAAAGRNHQVQAGVTLCGFQPGFMGRKENDSKGKREDAAGVFLADTGRTVRKHYKARLLTSFEHLAQALWAMQSEILIDRDLATDFFSGCMLTDAVVATLVDQSVQTRVRAENSLRSSAQAYVVPLSKAVEEALDARLSMCAASGRAFYTFDLLLALLEMLGSQVPPVLNRVQGGLAGRIREWIVAKFGHLTAEVAAPHRPLRWHERPEVREAQDMALVAGTITELHLFYAVLIGGSGTREGLQEFLGADFGSVVEALHAASLGAPSVLRTPRRRPR